MYLNPQIHDTQDTFMIHVGYIGIHSRIRISSPTCGRAWMRAGTNLHHVSRMYPACILITLADTCISHVSRMYPASQWYVPLRIHLRYMYPNMYLWSIPHVSLMYPRTTADTFIPHVSLINLRLILHVSCMYPACILEPLQIHVSRMDPACISHVYPLCSWLYLDSWSVVMTRPRYMYLDVSWYVSSVTSRKRIRYMYFDVSDVYLKCTLDSFALWDTCKIHVKSKKSRYMYSLGM